MRILAAGDKQKSKIFEASYLKMVKK